MYHNNNYAITWLSHDKSKTCNLIGLREFKTVDSAHTRNRAIVTRPFSLAEGWGLGTRLIVYLLERQHHYAHAHNGTFIRLEHVAVQLMNIINISEGCEAEVVERLIQRQLTAR